MISRRNIRVKVMQCIYAMEAENESLSENNSVSLLNKYLDNASELFTFSIFLITEVARYAEKHAKNRASKHLPTQEDLNINVKIAGNTILWQILESKSFQSTVKKGKYELLIDQELVKKIYLQLAESEIYKTYIQEDGREKKTEKELLSFIFTDLIMIKLIRNDFINPSHKLRSKEHSVMMMWRNLTASYISFYRMVVAKLADFL